MQVCRGSKGVKRADVKFSSEQVCQVSQLRSTATGEHVRKRVVWKCEGMLLTAVLCVGVWSGLVRSPAVVSGLVGVVVCGGLLRAQRWGVLGACGVEACCGGAAVF